MKTEHIHELTAHELANELNLISSKQLVSMIIIICDVIYRREEPDYELASPIARHYKSQIERMKSDPLGQS